MIVNKNKEIVFVSSGLVTPKKDYNELATHNIYLNYGLLGIASYLFRKGYNPRVYHGAYFSPDVFLKKFDLLDKIDGGFPLFLSLPSFYAVPWARDFVALISKFAPSTRIIAGGRWVTNGNSKWVKETLRNVDLIVEGIVEHDVLDLLDSSRWPFIPGNDISKIPSAAFHGLSTLNYCVLEGYEEIPPSIEISRGCGAGCDFCPEGEMPSSPLKSPELIFIEIDNYLSLTSNSTPKYYFEASNFLPSKAWIDDFKKVYSEKGYKFTWRAEVRADAFASADIYTLANCGLKIIDVGLESCSHQQLLRMRKTSDITYYLNQADVLLRKCSDAGVWPKLNIMLYPGETIKTINETIDWLMKRNELIKGVSVGPLTVFGCSETTNKYIKELAKYTARPVDDKSYLCTGITNLDLSHEINYSKSIELSISIAQQLMTSVDYFDIKNHGYYRSCFKYDDFRQLITDADKETLPFCVI